MKKLSFFLSILLCLFTFASADETPTVIVDSKASNVPDSIIEDLLLTHPYAGSIHIYAYEKAENVSPSSNVVAPCGLTYYTYSNISTYCAQHHGCYRTDFLISVARGSTTTLYSEYSYTSGTTVNGSVTVGTDKNVALPTALALGLNTSCSVSCKISTTRNFNGPSEASEYNSRSFYIAYYGNIGGWSCTATRTILPSTVQMSGQYIEPLDYVEYSIDRKINPTFQQ